MVPEKWHFNETLYPNNLCVSNAGYNLRVHDDYWLGEDVFQIRAYATLTNLETNNIEYIYSSYISSDRLYKSN